MRIKYKLSLLSGLSIIFILFFIAPFSFADGSVTLIQNSSNSQQSSTVAVCALGSPVTAGDSLMVTLDAAFIDHTTLSIGDTLGNTFTAFPIALNSASTWAMSWEAENIAHGGVSDTIEINYTDITGRGTYTMTCAEFLGDINFTQTGGPIAGSGSCNTCNLNLSTTTHKINYISGWSLTSQAPPFGGIAYNSLGGIAPKSGSGTSQAISGGGGSILAFHAETDNPVSVVPDSAITVTCSPACSETPVFIFAYYTSCISGNCATVTSTITGFLVPNFVNGLTSFSWLYFMIVVLVPVGEIMGILVMEQSAVLDRHAVIFVFLSLLLLDSIFGVMLNVVTVAMPFIFGILFGVYLWRGRG